MKKLTLKILDMTCASCAASVKKYLEEQDGVFSADINVATSKGIIEYDENKIDEKRIKKTIVETGYRVAELEKHDHMKMESHDFPVGSEHDHMSHISGGEKRLKQKVILSAVFTLPIFIRMIWRWEIAGKYFGISITDWVQLILATIVVFIFGWQFHISAVKALKRFSANMDSLISLGTLAAYFYSLWALISGGHIYFESAATITTLILLGKYLELKTKNRASRAMEKLMELGVKKARLIDNKGNEREIDVDQVKIGDILLVKPGEKMPLDGVIIEGKSNIDESMLTGESLPVFKEESSMVFGATLNKDGTIKIKVNQIGKGTMLAQIIQTVEEAQRFKPPIQRLADKIASIFVPVVISISGFTFLGWYFLAGNLEISLINAVAVLIISCPCALGIATPIAVMVGTSVGAKDGILIKDGESFEKARDIDTIIFDKTGTLTKGEPKVEKVLINDFSEKKVIKIGASLASQSNHPLSQSIKNLAKKKKISLTIITGFNEIAGQGLIGECREHKKRLLLGNRKLLKKNNINTEWVDKILEDNKNYGGTIIFIVHDKKVVGAFMIADEIKENAKKVIAEIKSLNLTPLIITGDNNYNARAVAKSLGVDEYLAEVLPQEKQKEVKRLQKEGKRVIFVGDGINDAPSLVRADLGIAMGSGTDIAKESGNIIIMKNDLEKVVEAIKLSRKTFKIIKQNLFWAFFYNVVAIPLAVVGLVNPMIGALAMGFSDVTVISNSLRIYKTPTA